MRPSRILTPHRHPSPPPPTAPQSPRRPPWRPGAEGLERARGDHPGAGQPLHERQHLLPGPLSRHRQGWTGRDRGGGWARMGRMGVHPLTFFPQHFHRFFPPGEGAGQAAAFLRLLFKVGGWVGGSGRTPRPLWVPTKAEKYLNLFLTVFF